MKSADLIKDLNDAQRTAVTHRDGPLLIVAGAGTGKTAVITRRIAWLIAEGLAKPDEILALTFTDKAAGEMEERVDRLLPYGYVDLWVQTFHAFGERMLRTHGLDIGLSTAFRVLSRTEQWMLLRRHLADLRLSYYRPLGNPTKFLQALVTHFSRAADELVTPEEYLAHVKNLRLGKDSEIPEEETARLQEVADAYFAYKRFLRDGGLLDFSDLINETLRLFRERPRLLTDYRTRFRYLLVDEFQDTNWAQFQLVKLLAGDRRNVAVVGDDDQSVYKFRGASVSNILDFQKDFPGCASVVLTENYRSRQEILDFAYAFIQHNNPDRLEAAAAGAISKRLVAARGAGGAIVHLHGKTLADEARLTVARIRELKSRDPEASWDDFAILARANDHAEPFLTALRIAGVPHEFLASRGLYQRPLTLDVLAYLRLLDDYHESAALYRILCSPISRLTHEDVIRLTHHADRKTVSLHEALRGASAVPGLSAEAAAECARLLGFVEKHAALTRTKPVTAVILAFLHGTGYLRAVAAKKEAEAREDLRVLNAFWKTVEDFVAETDDATVKAFLARVALEREAGETGTLPLDPDSGPELVRVMTVHAAKGLEFRHVFVANMVDKRFPSVERQDPIPLPDAFIKERLPGGDAHLEEERRLFYVACTRAKDSLFLTSAEDYGGARKKKPSRFLAEARLEAATALPTEPVVEIEPPKTGFAPLPVPERMSFSQFEAFERCPLQYKFEHVFRIPKAGNANKSFGQSVHVTLHELLARYRARRGADQQSLFGASRGGRETLGSLVGADELLEIYRERWLDDWYEGKTERLERFERGKEALLRYHAKLADLVLDIQALEQGFALKFDDVTVKGRIDRIDRLPDGTVEIIDYKTGAAKDRPDRDQLLIYQIAAERVLGLRPAKLTFAYLEAGKEVSFIGSAEEVTALEVRVRETAAAIRASAFAPTPGRDVCRFCDFRDICESSLA